MRRVELLYRCTRCNGIFTIKSNIPPEAVEKLVDAMVYGIESTASLRYNLNDLETHDCGVVTDSVVVRVGIGKLLGYNVIEEPDEEQPSHLRKVKG